MRSRPRVAAIRAALTAVEQNADDRGWGALPALLCLFDTTTNRHAPRLGVEAFGVDDSAWRLHERTVPGIRLPYWVGLKALTDHLTASGAPAGLKRRARVNQRRLIGMAFLCEGLDTSAGQDATTAGMSFNVDGVALRALMACDIDGRHYQILRVRGAANPTVTVLDDPSASVHASVIPACLHRLLTAAHS